MAFVYGLCLEGLPVRYVGKTIKTVEKRFHTHKVNAGYLDYPVYKWMRKHGDAVCVRVLEEVPDDIVDACEREWIKELRESGHVLLNCTDGGDGVSGWKHTDETKQKMSEAKQGYVPWMKGRKHSPETLKVISEAVKKARREHPMVFSEEHRRNLSESAKRARVGKVSNRRGTSKLTDADLRMIFELKEQGLSTAAIARVISISQQYVSSLLTGKNLVDRTAEYRKDGD